MSATNTVVDQTTVKKALSVSAGVIEEVTKALAARCNVNGKVSIDKMDENQLVQYQIAWLTSEQKIAEKFIEYAWDTSRGTGDLEQE
ncbi:acyl-CoA dehydrogenase, partial [Leptospira interrogans serovar Pomona]|nr:acyl-CoA dehydrogenase [Leptospira interrogans serovar Pomona]